jgi:tetratricopeptide (TPR) repeat protein
MRAATTWLAIALVLAPVRLVVAAPPRRTTTSAQSRPERADADEKKARAHFKKAERAFNLGKFAEALVSYQAAFEAKPLPAFVFNIAQCHRNLDDPERALFFYRRYLALDPEGPHRKLVEGLIEEQQAKLSEMAAAEEAARTAERVAAGEPGAAAETGGGERLDLGRAGRPGAGDPVAGSLARNAGPPVPVYRRWWVWAAGGAVVAVAAAALLIKREGPAPRGGLGVADFRRE